MTAWFRFLYFRSAARRTVFPLLLAVCLVSCASAPEAVPETEADNGQTVPAPAESAPSVEVPAGMPETETEAEMEAEAEASSAESPSGVSASDESLETGSDGNSPASPAVPPLFSPDEDLSGLAADEPGVTVLPGWTAPVADSGTAPQETPPADGVRSLAENAREQRGCTASGRCFAGSGNTSRADRGIRRGVCRCFAGRNARTGIRP